MQMDEASGTPDEVTSEQGSTGAMAGLVEEGSSADDGAEANQLTLRDLLDSDEPLANGSTGVEVSVASCSQSLQQVPKIMRWAANAKSSNAEPLPDKKFERIMQRKLIRKQQSWKLRIAATIMDDDERTSTEASEWVNQVARKIVKIQRMWRAALERKKREKTKALLDDEEKPPLVKNDWGWQMENDPWKILLRQSASQQRLLEQMEAYSDSDSGGSSSGSDYDSSEHSEDDSSEDDDGDEELSPHKRIKRKLMAAAKATRTALVMLGMDRISRSSFNSRSSSKIFKVSASFSRMGQANPWSPTQSSRKSMRRGLLRGLGSDLSGSSGRSLEGTAEGSRKNLDEPLSLVSVNSHRNFKNEADLLGDTMTHMRNEVMAVKGGKVSQRRLSPHASEKILLRTKMAAMSIRTTKAAVQDMITALGLDVNTLGPEDIDRIIRSAMDAKWRMTLLKKTLGDTRKGMGALRESAGAADLLDFPVKNFFNIQASATKRDTGRLRDAGRRLRHLEEVLGNVGTEVNSFLKDMKHKVRRSPAGSGSVHKKGSSASVEQPSAKEDKAPKDQDKEPLELGTKQQQEAGAAGDLTFSTRDSGSPLHPVQRPPLAASAATLEGPKSANVVTLPSLGFRALKQGPMGPANDIPIGARTINELQRQSGMGTCVFKQVGGVMRKQLPRINHNVDWNVQPRKSMPEICSLAGSRQPKHMPPLQEKAKRRRSQALAPTMEKAGATFTVGRIDARSHMESAVRFARAANHELAKRMERAHCGLDGAKDLLVPDGSATSREPRKTLKTLEARRHTSARPGMIY